jgi:hypothetical protein
MKLSVNVVRVKNSLHLIYYLVLPLHLDLYLIDYLVLFQTETRVYFQQYLFLVFLHYLLVHCN